MIRPPAINGVVTWPDGREVCDLRTVAGAREYRRRIEVMNDRQQGLDAITGEPMGWPTFEHQDGKGMGNSRQDDRTEIDGEWYNAAVSLKANSEKGSKRYHWQHDGARRVYVPREAN